MTELFLTRLAHYIVSADYSKIGPDEIHEIKRAVVDYVGCALGSWRIGIGRELVAAISSMGGEAEATVWGSGAMMPAPHAALAIGTIASHLELDTHADMIPAAFVVAESSHSSGRALIVALSAGIRVAAAMKQLLAAEIEVHGLHWPAQMGVYAAAAAACKLSEFSVEKTVAALSFAGCLAPVAPFEAFTQGAGLKDVYGGWCGMVGILASRLSVAGYGGPPNLLEGVRGLGRTWLHTIPSPDSLESALAQTTSQTTPALQFKQFAACASAQPALSAVELLLERHGGIDPDVIERVEISTYDYAVELSESVGTLTSISARVNLPYLAAALLLDGRVGPEQVETPGLTDRRLRDLAVKVSISVLPDTCTDLRSRTRPASVTVFLRDGTRLHAEVSEARWARSCSVSDEDIERKFGELVGDALEPEQRNMLLRMLWDMETVSDASQIARQTVIHKCREEVS